MSLCSARKAVHNSPPSSEANLRWQNRSHISRRNEECLVRGALRSGAELPLRQLTRDAERETSRRRPFLGTFPRLFASVASQSRPLPSPRDSGQTWPQKPSFAQSCSRFWPKTLRLCASPPRPRVNPLLGDDPPLTGRPDEEGSKMVENGRKWETSAQKQRRFSGHKCICPAVPAATSGTATSSGGRPQRRPRRVHPTESPSWSSNEKKPRVEASWARGLAQSLRQRCYGRTCPDRPCGSGCLLP